MSQTSSKDIKSLSPQQEAVIVALLAGNTQREAAGIGGVDECTVSRWLSGDSLFLATLNSRRAALWQRDADRLHALRGKAVDVLGELLSSEDERTRLKAAVSVLRAAGDLSVIQEDQSAWVDAEGIERERRRRDMMDSLTNLF